MSHTVKMLLGCTLPLLLLFVLPLIGLGEGATLFSAIVLMFACHLFMTGGGHGRRSRPQSSDPNQAGHHEHS